MAPCRIIPLKTHPLIEDNRWDIEEIQQEETEDTEIKPSRLCSLGLLL